MWRILYPFLSDWTALFLVPTAVMLFAGFRKPLADMLLAKSAVIVRRDSWMSVLTNGKIKAAVLSGVFVTVTLPILALQALEATKLEALALLLLCVASGSVALKSPKWLRHHFHGPFAVRYGSSIGAFTIAAVFVPLLAWINWNHITYPGEFRSMDFWGAVQFGVDTRRLPEGSWIAQLLAPLYALESMQVWLVAKYGIVWWIPPLLSLYFALVAFVIAKASAAIAFFTHSNIPNHKLPSDHIRTHSTSFLLKRGNTAAIAFWSTLLCMAGATITAALLGNSQIRISDRSIEYNPEPAILDQALSYASSEALEMVLPEVETQLSIVFDPVNAAIPKYADFRYSLRGEYTELGVAMQGLVNSNSPDLIGADLQNRLFDGFEQRIENALDYLRERYLNAFNANLESEILSALDVVNPQAVIGEATQLAMDDAVARASVSYPVAGTAAIAGSALTAGMASKVGSSIVAKAAAKGALKGGGVLAGAGSGIALCSWGGPLALACGVGGGIAVWLITDKAIVELDELINREEFEAELRTLIEIEKVNMKLGFESVLLDFARQVDEDNTETVDSYCKEFSLRERAQDGFEICTEEANSAI